MGFYTDHVLPRVINVTCGSSMLDPLRRRACTPLSGRVVEIGFGSGRNVGLYPAAVTSVDAIEPSDVAWNMAVEHVTASPVPIRRAGLDGQRLPFDNDTFDAALSTFTLCTIPDVDAALAEIARVVRPGGTVVFLEHGTAPDDAVRRWQRRLEPIQKRTAGGCHLTRDIPKLLTDNGFDLTALDQFYQHGAPRPFAALSLGSATAP
ncbi:MULTISPECIES: class I SAM-dependent methyltransferase [Gordonia]|uniref:Methyltransferase type 11 n=1 Tax=Gordonia jacobaea TaxID=122202 RepID=A0ABR5ICG1_9ACTN|nr:MULTISPECIES: class I SAM-dependent methyltransferase [Gordonia]KNA91330.1 methyltransferase type 11 [Gordonia jacobaea]OBC07611.1 methyltransferase type 11 [Gordonia sp. 852002-50395_SCH5434458]OBC19235.1 methyltransferase type 11 [Gordonia sp. 852002-50816_SCH5313054-a]OBC19660.1 methyltransferase type 11 [Gordonia sp. 852002-50816_SCH5313054-c]